MTTKSTDENNLAHSVTRRDFVNTALIGAGAALLHTLNSAFAQKPASGWNGYSGVGDFRHSNGETWDTMESAHAIRDAKFEGQDSKVIDTGEAYDLVIVAGNLPGRVRCTNLGSVTRIERACCSTIRKSSTAMPRPTHSMSMATELPAHRHR